MEKGIPVLGNTNPQLSAVAPEEVAAHPRLSLCTSMENSYRSKQRETRRKVQNCISHNGNIPLKIFLK